MAKKLFRIQTDKIGKGTKLMYENTHLTSWTGDLSSLTDGYGMFYCCSNLTTFNSDSSGSPVNLSSLTNGRGMFYNTKLTTFTSDLSSLTDGRSMFGNCYNLTTFTSDLSSLTDGRSMFDGCYNLTTFTSDLSSLTNGMYMFYNCSLNAPSVQNIALTINKITNNAKIDIGINTTITSDAQVKRDLGLIKHKGWDLYVNNSNATSNYTLPKYAGCTTIDSIKVKDANYLTNDIVNGVWVEHLPDLEDGNPTNSMESGVFYRCSKLTTFTSDLSSLTRGYNMFNNCYNLTDFTSNLSSLTNGEYMFYECSKLSNFTADLSSLTYGTYMFFNCSNLTTFTSNLSSLTGGLSMFSYSSITDFTSDLSFLTNGYSMFNGCSSLTNFTSNLSSLTNGSNMFQNCSNLTTFTSNLSSLTNGSNMFYKCSNLTTFISDSNGSPVNLSSLTNGNWMFYNCSNLTTFTSNLSSLTNGYYMFQNCKLDTDSLECIADTIKDVRDLTNGSSSSAEIYKTIHIGIGNTIPNANETTALNTIANKGWTVYVNGSIYTPSSSSGPSTPTPGLPDINN